MCCGNLVEIERNRERKQGHNAPRGIDQDQSEQRMKGNENLPLDCFTTSRPPATFEMCLLGEEK
jgi:hypothetical protein